MAGRQSNAKAIKRTQNACRPCRQSKIKCSGDSPCANCERRVIKCVFEEDNVRVAVSRRYLHELQKQVRDLRERAGSRATPVSIRPAISETEGSEDVVPAADWQGAAHIQTHNIWTSPFEVPSSIMRKTSQDRFNWIWLAPSSIFSFYDRLGLLMTDRLDLEAPPMFREEMVYPLSWTICPPDMPIDVGRLPSIDHALFLFQTVKFHFSQAYRLFEEELFVGHIKEFYYGDGLRKATQSRLWFIQFLLMLAFGKGFAEHPTVAVATPGATYFCRAMSLMPDHTYLWQGGVAAIEVLALVALFLYCVDDRKSSHVYLGQAIRIAMMEGLHTNLPEDQLGKDVVDQCRGLWWTLYILDRRFSSALGIPAIVHDDDITTTLTPLNAAAPEDVTLCLLVKLWQLMSRIISTIYKTNKIQLDSFMEMTRSILKSLADNAQEIEQVIKLMFYSSVGRLPKGTRLVTLTYHQCVIFATRPLLLSILKECLNKPVQPDQDWQDFLALTAPLISTGIKSAFSMLQILSQEGDLLETFFLSDLEFVYGSSLYLTMAVALFPNESSGRNSQHEAHMILDQMISAGNRVAGSRKKELLYMEGLFDKFKKRFNVEWAARFPLFTSDGTSMGVSGDELQNAASLNTSTQGIATPITATFPQQQMVGDGTLDLSDLGMMGDFGISSDDFYSLIEKIGVEGEL